MPPRTVEQFTLAMPSDVPFYENEDTLVRLRHAALYDYRNSPDLREYFIKTSEHLTKYPFVSLLSGINTGDGEKVLDIGLRYYSGCSVRQVNVQRALYVWEMITDANHETAVPNVSDSLLARAYSCLAYAYFELHQQAYQGVAVAPDPTGTRPRFPIRLPSGTPDHALANDLLYIAAVYADAAAGLGLISPTVLHTASWLVRIGERDGVDLRRSRRYGRLRNLWRAEAARSREYAEEQRRKALKVAKAPNAYACAAPGCGIGATQKRALMRCGGRCPEERRPHYCSKECQKKDWKAHKPVCKPDAELGAGNPPPGPPVGGAPAIDEDMAEVIDPEEELPVSSEGPGRSIDIEIPGQGTVRLVSRNLTSAVMRWMRDKVQEGA